METTAERTPPRRIEIRRITYGDMLAALAEGWQDLRAALWLDMTVAFVFVLGGWIIATEMLLIGSHWWVIVAALGFPIVGPFAAVAFYEVSRELAAGQRPGLASVARRILSESQRQVPSMVLFLVLLFMIWVYLAHMIFALFFGISALTNVTGSIELLLTPRGLAMLAVGTAVGAALSYVAFASTVVALPLIVDQEVDIVTAMIRSWQAVAANRGPMLAFGVIVAVATLLAMLPLFLGLLLVLPWLGHATFRLYRRLIEVEA